MTREPMTVERFEKLMVNIRSALPPMHFAYPRLYIDRITFAELESAMNATAREPPSISWPIAGTCTTLTVVPHVYLTWPNAWLNDGPLEEGDARVIAARPRAKAERGGFEFL